jgi:hypothetical protein
MQYVICCRKPNLQIGYALLKSKLGEFTGFGEDSFLLTSQFCSLLARWKVGEREFHYQEPSVPEEWHNRPRNSAWKNASTETKVTEVRTAGVLSDGRGLDWRAVRELNPHLLGVGQLFSSVELTAQKVW